MESSCIPGIIQYGKIAGYSHWVPLALTLVLTFFLVSKNKTSLLIKIFTFFALSFSFWLLGDVIAWTSSNYNIVSSSWAPLDYINIVFYLFGAYFFIVLITGRDLKLWQKIGLFILTIPGVYLTISGGTIPLFNQPWCEADNSQFLVNYKLTIEIATVLFIIIFGIIKSLHADKQKKKQIIIVGIALILFFATFSVTEYISGQTGIYEINLYSLFVLPLFLGLIIYAITTLEIFHLKSLATQLLIYVLLIMIGSQFFFLQSTTDKTLTTVTFALSLAFSYFLMKTIRREAEARKRIETLAHNLEQLRIKLEESNLDLAQANDKLQSLDKLKTEFLSLASHQLRSPLTAIKGYSSMLIEGSFGKLTAKPAEAVKRIYTSAQGLVNIVEDLLNVSKIEQGGMHYEMSPTDLAPLLTDLYNEMQIPAETKHLELKLDLPKDTKFIVNADPVKIKQVFLNLTDNSIKYTPKGFVKISLERQASNICFAVSDSGVGISPETKAKLFDKFSRGEGGKLNTGGSGLGLYLAKQIAKAHNGDVIIESEGLGKGSTFKVCLPALES